MVEQVASPVVHIELALDESLQRLVDPQDNLAVAVRDAIEHEVSGVVRVLGIPGIVVVKSRPWPRDDRKAYQRWMRLHINGQVCRFPDHLLRLVHSYVEEILPSPDTDAQTVLAWLKKILEDTPGVSRNEERIAEFFALACAQAVKESAALLLADPQVEAYATSLPRPENRDKAAPWPPSAAALLPILRTVLNSKVSIGDTEIVTQIFDDTDCSEDNLVEKLLDALPPGRIDICMPEAFRRELDTAGPEREDELIKFLRDGLYEELGVLYPQFRFVGGERLKPNCAAFQINHLTTLPIICLGPDQCLVNDTVERLRLMDVEGRATTNPANWQAGAIVGAKHKDALEAAGLTTWDQWGFLILALADVLRRNAGCFVHRTFAVLQLSELRTEFPAVVRTVLELFSVDEITRVLRALAGEQVSVRDLRFICESLLDFGYRSPDTSRYVIFDRPIPSKDFLEEADDFATGLVSFVRTRLNRYITFKASRGSNTIVVYLLDYKMEEMVTGFRIGFADLRVFGSQEDEEQKDVLLDAIQAELQHLPPTAAVPWLLTSNQVRPRLKSIIGKEFPRLFVIAYGELDPQGNIQPVARISPPDRNNEAKRMARETAIGNLR